jgi:hypothetical protein
MKFDGSFAINAAVALIVLICCYSSGGWELIGKGVVMTSKLTAGMVPTLVAVFLMMGVTMTIIKQSGNWIPPSVKGERGLLGTFKAAVVVPGSITAASMVNVFWHDGKTNRLSLILFLVLIPNVNILILAFQIMAMDARLVAIRALLSLGLAGAVMAIFGLLGLFFPRATEPIISS